MKYLPILYLIFLSSFFCTATLNAQFRGKIIDIESGNALEYASIISEDGKDLFISGPGGFFSIEDEGSDSLNVTISHIGYHKRAFTLTQNTFSTLALFPDYNQIGEVLVTATQFTSSLKSSAGSISLLPAELIDNPDDPTIREAINMGPGVYMARGTLTTNRLIIRGIGSRNPYGTNRIRIYLDKIPLNTVDGGSSPENINPEILDRITILKGPSSAIYGAGLGGTVKMLPEFQRKEGFSGEINTALHSWSGHTAGLNAALKKDKHSLNLSARKFFTEGYRENSHYDRKDFFFGGKYQEENINISYIFNYLTLRAGIPSSLNKQDFLEAPESAADSWAEVDGFEDYDILTAGINANYRITDKLFGNTVIFSNYGNNYESRPFNIFSSEQVNGGMRQSIEYRRLNFKLLTGYEAIYELSDWEIFETLSGIQGDRLNKMQDRRMYFSGFLHSLIDVLPGLRIEPALSLTYVRYEINDQFENDEDLSGDYSYDPEFSPRLGLNYQLKQNTHLYASAGHGFSPPGLEETLLPEGEANTALRPESGWTYDLGIKGDENEQRLYYDLGVYYTRLKDLLVTKRISIEEFIGVNAGKTEHYGAELFLRYQFFGLDITDLNSLLFTSSMAYSVNSFIDFVDDNVDYSGKNLPGIPTVSLNYSLEYSRMEKWNVIARYRFYGKQYMNDANTEIYTGHQLIDLRLGYRKLEISKLFSLEFYLGIRNILNNDYASMILVNAPSFGGSAPRYYYPGNPRNYIVGMKVHFN